MPFAMSEKRFEPSRRTFAWGLALAALRPGPAGALSAPNADTLLRRADEIRNPDRAFAVTTALLEFKNDRQTQTMSLRAYSSSGGPAQQFRSLVEILAPAQDKGKLILKDGVSLWMFDPVSKATIRISPQQRLLGQAANGDVVTTNFAFDYRAKLAGADDITDGDRKAVHCWKLSLEARTPDTTYRKALLWLAQDDNRPVKAQFFVDSGMLLKTAFYRRMQPVLGIRRPTETVMIDGLDPKWITVMRFSHHASRDIPDTWLQRDYLPRFKAQ